MTQLRANAVHRLASEFVNRLRYFLAGSGGEDAATLADKSDRKFAEELHDLTCKRLGIDPNMSNRRGTHPWNRFGGNRSRK